MNRADFEHFMLRPGMYVGRPTYERIIVWLDGVDFGSNGLVLLGFKEWMFTRMDDWYPFSWPGVLQEHAIKHYNRPFQPNKPEDDEILIEHLFQMLREYLADRDRHEGLKDIYVKYQRMMDARAKRDEEEAATS